MRTPPPSLKARALRLLAQREHSRIELRRKLLVALRRAERAASAVDRPGDVGAAAGRKAAGGSIVDDDSARARQVQAVEALLDELEAAGWLSSARFVESRVHARAPRFGSRRIEAELARHGLEVDAGLAAHLQTSEPDRAQAIWARKFGHPPVDARERARQMRFLAGRGFAPEVVRRVVPPPADGTGTGEE